MVFIPLLSAAFLSASATKNFQREPFCFGWVLDQNKGEKNVRTCTKKCSKTRNKMKAVCALFESSQNKLLQQFFLSVPESKENLSCVVTISDGIRKVLTAHSTGNKRS